MRLDHDRCRQRGDEERDLAAAALPEESRAAALALRDHEGGDRKRRRSPRCARGALSSSEHRVEVVELALSEDLDAARLDVRMKPASARPGRWIRQPRERTGEPLSPATSAERGRSSEGALRRISPSVRGGPGVRLPHTAGIFDSASRSSAADLVRGCRRRASVGDAGRPSEPRDSREGLQMAGGRLRRERERERSGRRACRRARWKSTPSCGRPTAGNDISRSAQLAVRDRDAAPSPVQPSLSRSTSLRASSAGSLMSPALFQAARHLVEGGRHGTAGTSMEAGPPRASPGGDAACDDHHSGTMRPKLPSRRLVENGNALRGGVRKTSTLHEPEILARAASPADIGLIGIGVVSTIRRPARGFHLSALERLAPPTPRSRTGPSSFPCGLAARPVLLRLGSILSNATRAAVAKVGALLLGLPACAGRSR